MRNPLSPLFPDPFITLIFFCISACILVSADGGSKEATGDAAAVAPGGKTLTAHEEILALRKRLPVYPYREEFLAAVRDHQVCIMIRHHRLRNREPSTDSSSIPVTHKPINDSFLAGLGAGKIIKRRLPIYSK